MGAWIAEHSIEIFGAITGILFVFLEIKQNIWLWPVGIITSATYVWVFFDSKFYADMSLQFYYLTISFLGWYWWLKGGKNGNGGVLKVSRVTSRISGRIIMAFIVLQAGIWYVLDRFTDSPVPFGDAFTTAMSVIATWMLARKILEHWVLWIIADVVSMGLYIYKGLYPTVVLFAVYSTMAVVGYFEWIKGYRLTQKTVT